MMPSPLPDGWRLAAIGRITGGCLLIVLDYRDEATYRIIWHSNDTVTMNGSTPREDKLAFDPITVALALSIAGERHMTPNHSLRAFHPRS